MRACTATTILWRFGEGADPVIETKVQQVCASCDLWGKLGTVQRKRVRRVWMRSMPRVVADERRWQKACGPLEATICTLVDLGWKPIAPDAWIVDEDTVARVGGTAYARAHIAARAREDMKAKVAKHAEKHAYGK